MAGVAGRRLSISSVGSSARRTSVVSSAAGPAPIHVTGWDSLERLLCTDEELPDEDALISMLTTVLNLPHSQSQTAASRRRSIVSREAMAAQATPDVPTIATGALDPAVTRKITHPSGHIDLAVANASWSSQLRDGSFSAYPASSRALPESRTLNPLHITNIAAAAHASVRARSRRASTGSAAMIPQGTFPLVSRELPADFLVRDSLQVLSIGVQTEDSGMGAVSEQSSELVELKSKVSALSAQVASQNEAAGSVLKELKRRAARRATQIAEIRAHVATLASERDSARAALDQATASFMSDRQLLEREIAVLREGLVAPDSGDSEEDSDDSARRASVTVG
jgi:hypothetical protein